MKYIEKYLKDIIKVKPLGKLTTEEDELDGISGEMVYIDGKCSNIFISHIDYANWLEKQESCYSFEIKKGHWYKCVCDYMLNNSDLMFKNDSLYYCRSDWRLGGEIDERNVKNIGVNGYKSFFRPATNQEIKEWLEKQDEQKSIDKFEPKFKVGDWISNDMCDAHIASIEDGMYYFDEGDGLSIVFVDEHYHLWTIEDAMDGDVLVSRSPFIYGKQCPYGGLNWCNNKFIKASNFIFTDSPVHPATKEQRDFLFQKMKEAGYTFDFKNKELKKLSQLEVTKISDQEEIAEIPFGAKDSELQEATYFIPKGFHAEIDDDKVVIKKGEKPTAWSKKDEKMFKYALHMIEWYSGKNEDKSRFVSDWLKSLKQRIGG